LSAYAPHRALRSFPTRRSSDLTLRSAALDPRGRELLAAGMVTEELESTGFDAFEGMRIPARRASRPRPKGSEATPTKQEKERLQDRKSTRLNSSHQIISYAVFC